MPAAEVMSTKRAAASDGDGDADGWVMTPGRIAALWRQPPMMTPVRAASSDTTLPAPSFAVRTNGTPGEAVALCMPRSGADHSAAALQKRTTEDRAR